jgi:peptidoglycan-N-acetylglucosamine deacetylase
MAGGEPLVVSTLPKMMKSVINMKVSIIVLLLSLTAAAQTGTTVRKMAVTIDDLPYAGVGQPSSLTDAQRATTRILAAFKKHDVPVVAFVIEGKLQVNGERDARTALLKQWVDAGMILGNHTYSHPDFNNLTVEQFEEEILKGEIVTRRLMRSRQPYQLYFRHPMTHTGDTQAKKEAIEKFLNDRGYKVTPHTIENSDFIFNVVYVLALREGDRTTAQRVRDDYLDFTAAATEFAERFAPKIFGREVTQTLLIHANDINADSLEEMLARFSARGFHFVSLDEAMKDPAYQTKDTMVSRYGPTWLWRWMNSKGMNIRGMNIKATDDPEPPQWVVARYQKWLSSR